jgi:CBS domain-containing protein
LLWQNQVSGAPVVNAEGKCIGVLSAMDVLRMAENRPDVSRLTAPPLPVTCSYQISAQAEDGSLMRLCTLPAGVCPIQRLHEGAHGEKQIVCSQPHSVLVDWQIVELEKLPDDDVRQFMTTGPVTVRADTDIRELARMMINAHIHRLIVVDEADKPIGIVSSSDLLIALARGDDEA